MAYQDNKIFRALLTVFIGVAFAVLILWMLENSNAARPIVDMLPFKETAAGGRFWMGIFSFGVAAAVFLGSAIDLLRTTPEQNEAFLRSKGRPLPSMFPDASDPYYKVPTWIYLLRRLKFRA